MMRDGGDIEEQGDGDGEPRHEQHQVRAVVVGVVHYMVKLSEGGTAEAHEALEQAQHHATVLEEVLLRPSPVCLCWRTTVRTSTDAGIEGLEDGRGGRVADLMKAFGEGDKRKGKESELRQGKGEGKGSELRQGK
jgi:hypothetical protein